MYQGKKAGCLPLGWSTAEMNNCFKHNICVYLVLRHGVLMVLCTGLPITTTISGEWLNSLILYDNIKCITSNGQVMIYAGADFM